MSEVGSLLAFDLGDATPLGGGRMRYVVDFGNANAGGAPAFTIYKRLDTLDDLAQPVITEISGGQYFWDVDWPTVLATSITYKIELAGIELSGVISSPTTSIPGTTVAEAGISSLTGYEQVGPIVAKAGVECGVLALSPAQVAAYDPFASSDPQVLQMLRLLDGVGRDLATRLKVHLQREFSLTTTAGVTSYAVPADWSEPVDETLWDRPGLLPLHGPVSAQEEAALKAGVVSPSIAATFRYQGNRITFPVDPGEGHTYYGIYVSRYWVQTEASGTGPDADHVTAATDYVLFDPELVILGLCARFLTKRGFDNAGALAEYQQRLDTVLGMLSGGRTLSLSGRYPHQLVSTANLPATGWGQ